VHENALQGIKSMMVTGNFFGFFFHESSISLKRKGIKVMTEDHFVLSFNALSDETRMKSL